LSDLAFVSLAILFFILSFGYLAVCEHLMK